MRVEEDTLDANPSHPTHPPPKHTLHTLHTTKSLLALQVQCGNHAPHGGGECSPLLLRQHHLDGVKQSRHTEDVRKGQPAVGGMQGACKDTRAEAETRIHTKHAHRFLHSAHE